MRAAVASPDYRYKDEEQPEHIPYAAENAVIGRPSDTKAAEDSDNTKDEGNQAAHRSAAFKYPETEVEQDHRHEE